MRPREGQRMKLHAIYYLFGEVTFAYARTVEGLKIITGRDYKPSQASLHRLTRILNSCGRRRLNIDGWTWYAEEEK